MLLSVSRLSYLHVSQFSSINSDLHIELEHIDGDMDHLDQPRSGLTCDIRRWGGMQAVHEKWISNVDTISSLYPWLISNKIQPCLMLNMAWQYPCFKIKSYTNVAQCDQSQLIFMKERVKKWAKLLVLHRSIIKVPQQTKCHTLSLFSESIWGMW